MRFDEMNHGISMKFLTNGFHEFSFLDFATQPEAGHGVFLMFFGVCHANTSKTMILCTCDKEIPFSKPT